MGTNDMKLQEVLKQIRPCDTQKPYIFISYSSVDCELVWRDALEFQRRGYNVWLDEKNLDKTKPSWKIDALEAIKDMYCMLVVFYVSKTSLTSVNCYDELAMTVDEDAIAYHMGPVKFIAIDVENIGNIVDYTRDLHKSITSNPELTKEVKSKMVFTMHSFMKNFFDSNNEKVRIHPKNEVNRKMDYYDDILAAFPDEARVDEPVKTAKAPVKTVSANETSAINHTREIESIRAKQKVEAKARAEAEAKVKAEEARVRAEAEAKAREKTDIRPGYGLLNDIFGIDKSRVFSKEEVELAYKRSNQKNSGEVTKFMSAKEAGPKKVQNSVKAYAKNVLSASVIALMDTTLFGSAKEGVLITNHEIYFSDEKNRGFNLNRIKSVSKGSKDYNLKLFFDNEDVVEVFVPSCHIQKVLDFFEALFEIKTAGKSKVESANVDSSGKETEVTIDGKNYILEDFVEDINDEVLDHIASIDTESDILAVTHKINGITFYESVSDLFLHSKNQMLSSKTSDGKYGRSKAIDKTLPGYTLVTFAGFCIDMIEISVGSDFYFEVEFADFILTKSKIFIFDNIETDNLFDNFVSTFKYEVPYEEITSIDTRTKGDGKQIIQLNLKNSDYVIFNISTSFDDAYDNLLNTLYAMTGLKK